MRRATAGPRAARIRLDKAVLVAVVRVAATAGALLLVAACGPASADPMATASTRGATARPMAPVSTPAAAASAPATSPAPQPVVVPAVVGMTVAQARSALSGARLRWRIQLRRTSASAPGTVLTQSPPAGQARNPGGVITIVVAQAPPPSPKTTPAPEPTTAAPAPACHPSYVGACLDPDASDYDCIGGSGNGPKYTGRVTVVGPDVFDLDRDGDGIGCE